MGGAGSRPWRVGGRRLTKNDKKNKVVDLFVSYDKGREIRRKALLNYLCGIFLANEKGLRRIVVIIQKINLVRETK